ncbi:MAG: hypothetical protein ACLQER_19635 [Streptosporangiaceae bacterium]
MTVTGQILMAVHTEAASKTATKVSTTPPRACRQEVECTTAGGQHAIF